VSILISFIISFFCIYVITSYCYKSGPVYFIFMFLGLYVLWAFLKAIFVWVFDILKGHQEPKS